VFALQSAIGNRASASLMREASGSSNAAPAPAKGNKRAYVTIEAEKQGKFKGNSPIKGREDAIQISNYRLSVTAPRDVATGQSSGKRQYQAISFKKPVDASSPQFMQALTTNETLKTVTFHFYGQGENGEERVYQTVTLTDAHLKGWSQDFDSGDDLEIVELVFETITLDSNTGKISTQDTWTAQK
jgi:type VI secretion system secreted protein Hcp